VIMRALVVDGDFDFLVGTVALQHAATEIRCGGFDAAVNLGMNRKSCSHDSFLLRPSFGFLRLRSSYQELVSLHNRSIEAALAAPTIQFRRILYKLLALA
jgi:hypothetical protein